MVRTADMHDAATAAAAALGLPFEDFGAKSFRIGGATDLHHWLGAAGAKAVLLERGRWGTDIGLIYSRFSSDQQLEASVAMSHVESQDMESVMGGWAQPSR